MNVSLLRDSKLLHGERRSSRGSVRGPSRQPSMASLRPHSPNSQGMHTKQHSSVSTVGKSAHSRPPVRTTYTDTPPRIYPIGSRRGSRGSSNASLNSNKSPTSHHPPHTKTPMLESVTVDIQSPKV